LAAGAGTATAAPRTGTTYLVNTRAPNECAFASTGRSLPTYQSKIAVTCRSCATIFVPQKIRRDLGEAHGGGWREMTLFDVEVVVAVFAIAAVITYWVAARSRS
jgi:hypothetical protein